MPQGSQPCKDKLEPGSDTKFDVAQGKDTKIWCRIIPRGSNNYEIQSAEARYFKNWILKQSSSHKIGEIKKYNGRS